LFCQEKDVYKNHFNFFVILVKTGIFIPLLAYNGKCGRRGRLPTTKQHFIQVLHFVCELRVLKKPYSLLYWVLSPYKRDGDPTRKNMRDNGGRSLLS